MIAKVREAPAAPRRSFAHFAFKQMIAVSVADRAQAMIAKVREAPAALDSAPRTLYLAQPAVPMVNHAATPPLEASADRALENAKPMMMEQGAPTTCPWDPPSMLRRNVEEVLVV